MEESTALSRKDRLPLWLCPQDLEQGERNLEGLVTQIFRVSRVWVGAEKARDVVQETIRRLLQGLDLQPELWMMEAARKTPYVLTIARNVRFEMEAGRKRDSKIVEEIIKLQPPTQWLPEPPHEPPSLEDVWPNLEDCFDELKISESDRRLLRNDQPGRTWLKRIALELNISVNSAYVRRHRLLKKLRRCLQKKKVLEAEDSGFEDISK